MNEASVSLWQELQRTIKGIEHVLSKQAIAVATMEERQKALIESLQTKTTDQEARLRRIEEKVIRHHVFSAIAAAVSAALLTAVFNYFATH